MSFKRRLASRISKEFGIDTNKAKRIVRFVFSDIKFELEDRFTAGESVPHINIEIRGFGSFHVRDCKPRKGRNVQANTPVEIPRRYRVGFRPHFTLD